MSSLDLPNCHYHPNNKIAYLCLNQCTLPLCDICLAQHRKTDSSGECMPKIVEYQKAQDFALEILETQREMAVANIEQFASKFCQFKNEVLAAVEKALTDSYLLLKEGTCKMDTNLHNIQQKIKRIKDNEVGELIILFLNICKEAEPHWVFNYSIDDGLILKQLQAFTGVTKLEQEIVDELKRKQEKLTRLPTVQNIEQKIRQIQSRIKSPSRKPETLMSEVGNYQMLSQNRSEVRRNESGRTQRRFPRPGIFVSMSPKQRGHVSSFSTHTKDAIVEKHGTPTANLTQSQVIRGGNKSMEWSNTRRNNQENAVSRASEVMSQSAKKWGESQLPEKVTIYKYSGNKNRLQLKTPTSSEKSQKKELENVINRHHLHSNSSSSRLVIGKEECMNPQAMRELILRKKHAQPQQAQPQLLLRAPAPQ